MNRDQKAAVIEEVAGQIEGAEAIFAVDYRGISVPQAAELRQRLVEAGASFRVVKNTLTIRAADQAGAAELKELLEGPTAFTFVTGDGDVALAAKAIATFRREHEVPEFKGGRMGGAAISVEQIQELAKLPARDVLNGQLVGIVASPLTGLVRGLNGLIAGIASQLQQIADQGLVAGEAPAPAAEAAPAEETSAAEAEEAPAAEAEEAPAAEAEEAPPAPEESPATDDAPPAEGNDAPEEAAEETSETSENETEEKEG